MVGESGHHGHGHADGSAVGYGPGGHAAVGGFSVAANGLRIVPETTRLKPGDQTGLDFRIVDEHGTPVTGFEAAHDELAHLIVVRRDLTRFQHRHPTLEADGTWRCSDLVLPDAGVYRAFVDVVVDGRPTTLGVDLFVPGPMSVERPPGSTRRATAGDVAVDLRTDEVQPGTRTELKFEFSRGGERVTRLGRYLGALGHLVVLRDGDLGYVHVHPEATDPSEGIVKFVTRFPTAGRYRLFLQAKPNDRLVTVRFDVRID